MWVTVATCSWSGCGCFVTCVSILRLGLGSRVAARGDYLKTVFLEYMGMSMCACRVMRKRRPAAAQPAAMLQAKAAPAMVPLMASLATIRYDQGPARAEVSAAVISFCVTADDCLRGCNTAKLIQDWPASSTLCGLPSMPRLSRQSRYFVMFSQYTGSTVLAIRPPHVHMHCMCP